MKIIGITGGIGSGKTTLTLLLSLFGIPIYYADSRSKILLNKSPIIKKSLKRLLGNDIYKNNALDKKLLASYIFNNKNLLEQVNKIIHPEVEKDFQQWIKQHKKYPYVIIETAILFESEFDKLVHLIINITAPLDDRIKRCMKRDGTNQDQIEERIKNQISEAERQNKSSYTIINDNHHSVIEQVQLILKDINF